PRTELRCRHADGTWAVCESVGEWHRSGDSVELVIHTRDITEQRAAALERNDNETVAEVVTRMSQSLVARLAEPGLPELLAASARDALGSDAATLLLHRRESGLLVERSSSLCTGAAANDDEEHSGTEVRGEIGRLLGSLERAAVVEASDRI